MTIAKPQRRHHLRFGGLVYVLASLLVGVAALLSQANLLFWAFGVMMGAIIVSGLINGLMLSGLSIRRLAVAPGVVGEPVVLRYEIANRNRITPCFGLILEELDGAGCRTLRGRPIGYVLHLGPGRRVRGETVAMPARRGTARVARLCVSAAFPMGLLRKSVTYDMPAEVVVYPQTGPVRRDRLRWAVASDQIGSTASPRPGGVEEFFGLREYRTGDSVRLIDWKHTARHGSVLCREMTRLQPPRLVIVVDVRPGAEGAERPDEARVETAISLAASVACEALAMGVEVGLRVAGATMEPITPGGSRHQQRIILTALAKLETAGALSDSQRRVGVTATEAAARWLVIHAGSRDAGLGPAAAVRLTPDDVDDWLTEPLPRRGDRASAAGPGVESDRVERPAAAAGVQEAEPLWT